MSIPAQQKALLLTRHAGPYELAEIDVPRVNPNSVLIRVEAAALNPTDWRTRFTQYSFVVSEYPTIQGTDAAGVIIALGKNVTAFKVGDRVIHQGAYSDRKLGAFQQYTAVPASLVAKIPENIGFDRAATIPLALMTAAIGLYQSKIVPAGGGASLTPFWREGGRAKYMGQPILILGGASAVGQFCIQFAKLSGFSPIITTVSSGNQQRVLSLGATHTVDRTLPMSALPDAVKGITSQPVQVIYDAVSSEETQNISYDILAPGGMLVVVLIPAIKAEKLVAEVEKDVNLVYGSPHLDMHKEFGADVYKHVHGWFASGLLTTTAAEYIPGGLAVIPEVQERLRAGRVGARKMVVHPSETI